MEIAFRPDDVIHGVVSALGDSRKSFLRSGVGDRPAPERDWGTAAAVSAAVFAPWVL